MKVRESEGGGGLEDCKGPSASSVRGWLNGRENGVQSTELTGRYVHVESHCRRPRLRSLAQEGRLSDMHHLQAGGCKAECGPTVTDRPSHPGPTSRSHHPPFLSVRIILGGRGGSSST